jgi:hypothetical protein
MELDKELYRQAQHSYKEWNQVELAERVRNAGELTPQQGWERYVGLWEFCMKIAPQPSQQQRLQRIADLVRYYQRMQKVEAWRQFRDGSPR